MKLSVRIIFTALAFIAANAVMAQESASADESEQLKIAALEALMSAPEERALPIVEKVLSGSHSNEVKMRALFVLSQIDLPGAQALLLDTAKNGTGTFRLEAIRMIGISGDPAAMAGLADIYATGDSDAKSRVLHAYMIADDIDAVYAIAANATDDDEFENAVHMLGIMGANEELRNLRDKAGNSGVLIHAYAMAGDVESLRAMALDNSDPEKQAEAIQGLGIVGGEEVNATLLEIYRGTDSEQLKDAALHGMLVSAYDEGVLELFRSSQDGKEKRVLLRMLVMMDSEAAMEAIEKTLSGGQ